MITEEFIRRALEGKFFPYIGKPVGSKTTLTLAEERITGKRFSRFRDLKDEPSPEPEVTPESPEPEAIPELLAAYMSPAEPTYKQIVMAVAAAHRVSSEAILGRSRVLPIALARHHAVWEIRTRRKSVSLTKIGLWLDRNHSTILSSLEFMEENRQRLEGQIQAVARILNNAGIEE